MEEKQNDKHMETTTDKATKNIIVSLIDGSEELVMKLIHHYKLTYQVVGYDQGGAMILQLHYSEAQESTIKEITDLVKFLEMLAAFLVVALAAACHEFSAEMKAAYQQLKKEKETNGNEKGE